MCSENQETGFKLESVELLLETAKSEYESEHNRTTIIDTKIGISLPIISAYFIALAQMNNYKAIFAFSVSSFWDIIIPSILFVSYTSSLILSLISVLLMVSVIITREYNTLKPIDLYDEDYLKNDRLFLCVELLSLYIQATVKNKSQNNKRIPLYRKSWALSIVSILLFVVFVIISNSF